MFLKTIITDLVFLIIGILFLTIGIRNIKMAKACEDWPSVQGTIVSSYVERSSGGRRSSGGYYPRVRYNFFLDGKYFENKRISFISQKKSSRAKAEVIASEYKKGQSVEVFYSPKNPEHSVLVKEYSKGIYLLPAFGLGALIILVYRKISA